MQLWAPKKALEKSLLGGQACISWAEWLEWAVPAVRSPAHELLALLNSWGGEQMQLGAQGFSVNLAGF